MPGQQEQMEAIPGKTGSIVTLIINYILCKHTQDFTSGGKGSSGEFLSLHLLSHFPSSFP